MKLFELRPKKNLPYNDNPWKPWYDKVFGFIVRAETEAEARKYADVNAREENIGEFLGEKMSETKHPWLDENYSTCIEMNSDGNAGVIMLEFLGA